METETLQAKRISKEAADELRAFERLENRSPANALDQLIKYGWLYYNERTKNR